MSDYEAYTGNLIFLPKSDGETVYDQMRDILLKDKNIELKDYSDGDIRMEFFDVFWRDEYILHNSSLYKVNKTEHDPYDSSIQITDNKDGTLSFYCKFYNGGTCLAEMLEEGLDDLTKIK